MRTSTVNEIADRVELSVLSGVDPTVNGLAQTILGDSGAKKLAQVEDALTCVAGRADKTAQAYPLEKEDNIFVPKNAPFDIYTLLLTLSHVGPTQVERANEVLDYVGAAVLTELLGSECVVVEFAWPVRASADPRPEDFPTAVRWLGEKVGLPAGTGYRHPRRKDGGVDLVGVRRLAGSALGAPAMLVQTTLSKDVHAKAKDVDVNMWRSWIDFSPATQSVLLVPHIVPTVAMGELHTSGIIVLDRLRIVDVLHTLALPTAVNVWAQKQYQDLLDCAAGRT